MMMNAMLLQLCTQHVHCTSNTMGLMLEGMHVHTVRPIQLLMQLLSTAMTSDADTACQLLTLHSCVWQATESIGTPCHCCFMKLHNKLHMRATSQQSVSQCNIRELFQSKLTNFALCADCR